MKYYKVDDVINLLKEFKVIESRYEFEIIEHVEIKPGRFVCQTCGYNYRDCVCDHNALVKAFTNLERK